MQHELSVVICSLNGADGVDRCLSALRKQKDVDLEIIVVDDGSTDNTSDVAREHGVTVIRHSENQGLAAARNTGVRAASGPIVAFLDDDCEPDPEWARELLSAYENDVIGAGGDIVPCAPDGFMLGFLKRNNPLLPLEMDLARSQRLPYRLYLYVRRQWQPQERHDPRDVYSLVGANMSFRRAAFSELAFDERFRFGGEDLDMCLLLSRAFPYGRLVVNPAARVRHHFVPTLSDTLRRSRSYGRGCARLYRKWPTMRPTIFPVPFLMLAMTLGAVFFPVAFAACLLVPLLAYPKGIRLAVKNRQPACLLDSYVQLAQETYGNIGYLRGMWEYRHLVPEPAVADIAEEDLAEKGLPEADLPEADLPEKDLPEKDLPGGDLTPSAGTAPQQDPPAVSRTVPPWMARGSAAIAMLSKRPLAPSAAGLVLLALLVPLHGSWAAQAVLIPLLLILPGVILLRALRIPGAVVAANPVYVPTASIVVLIASGLAVDLTGPLLGVAEPLRPLPLLLGLEITCAAILATSRRAGTKTQIPWGELSRPIRLAWPLLFPVLGAAGALRLNAGHTGHVAALAIILVIGTLTVFFLVASRFDDALLTVIIYATSLSMLWSFSLRGDLIYGFDIAKEYYELQQTLKSGIWHIGHHGDPYGAMLSLTVLPTELHALSGMPGLFIFKAVYPAIEAIFPVAVFSISRRYLTGRWAFLAATLVVMQQPFFQEFPALARQEIAMALFAALISALLENTSTQGRHWTFVSLLSISLVVSHYSTDYMTIALLGIAIVIQFAFSWFRLIPRANGAMVAALCVCAGGAMLWYGLITQSSSNVSQFIAAATSDGLNILPNHSGNFLISYLQGEQPKVLTSAQYQKFIAAYYQVHMPYVTPLPDATQLQYAVKPAVDPTPASVWPLGSRILNLLSLLVQQFANLLAGLGALVLSLGKKVPAKMRQVGVIALAAMVILVLVRVSGTIAQQYNPGRAFLQMLVVLGTAVCWTLASLEKRQVLRAATLTVCAASLVVFMTVSSTVDNVFIGGSTDANLANRFDDYQSFVVSSQEIASGEWLNSHSRPGELIYADPFGRLRLAPIIGDRSGVLIDITPETINSNSTWVYASRTNVLNNIARSDTGNYYISFAFPKLFLDNNFNKVYTNGVSEVFHR